MEEYDKSFRQIIENLKLSKQNFTTWQDLLTHIAKIEPAITQAIMDGRTLESVVRVYFPHDHDCEIALDVVLSAYIAQVLIKCEEVNIILFARKTPGFRHGDTRAFLVWDGMRGYP